MRFPSGSEATNVRPNTSSCGASTTVTPLPAHSSWIASTAAVEPGTITPTSENRGAVASTVSARPDHSANSTPGATSKET